MGNDLDLVRREIEAFLSARQLKSLHKESFATDLLTTLVLGCTPYILIYCIATFPMPPVALVAVSILQGWLFLACGLLGHDQMIHRKVFGRFGSRLVGALLFLPSSQRATRYRAIHFIHHRYLNTERDTEFYKIKLSTTAQRLAFCTAPGYIYLKARIQRALKGPEPSKLNTKTAISDRRWLKFERVLQGIASALSLLLAFYKPAAFVFGIALPFLLWLPLANMCRLVGDHAVRDPKNIWWIATYFKPNIFSKVLFLYDAGEHHVIHHIFPNIPFYRMERAGNLLRPLFESKGLVETRSHLQLIRMWMFDAKPHGNLWR